MPIWLIAGLWGLFAGAALLVGTAIGYFAKVSQRWIASVMAFGSGVLISALTFELMDKAYHGTGFYAASGGFLGGAVIYTIANWLLTLKGAKHRKRSDKQPSESDQEGSGMAIAVGALMDGIPESIAIGLTMLQSTSVNMVTVIAIFISNIPEGLSSTAGMKKAGRSKLYIFGVWAGIAVISGLAALFGNIVFQGVSNDVVASITALAAGAILTMLVDTMIPEAFHIEHNFAGLITVVGFLVSFIISRLAGGG